ncbi:MAG TPA: glycosyltransferase, partial [Acidimicrobiales bacterium]|nr:glycosyltransferase [Acidimicrobiales bacterium]
MSVRVAFDVSAIPPKLTGAGVFVARLVESLATLDDVSLALVTRRDDAPRWTSFGDVHALAPTARPSRLLWEQRSGPAAAAATGASVWHGPHYTLPLRVGVPTVVTVHDLTFFDHPETHERSKVLFFRRMIRAACKRADAVVSVSERTTSRLRELVAVTGELVTIPHGVDTSHFSPDGPREDRGYPYVLFWGTIEPRKNVDGLVRAFARLHRSHPDLRLVLAGLP